MRYTCNSDKCESVGLLRSAPELTIAGRDNYYCPRCYSRFVSVYPESASGSNHFHKVYDPEWFLTGLATEYRR